MSVAITARIYLEDTDAGGVVYHTSYLRLMERARTERLRQCGIQQSDSFGQGTSFVVSEMTVRFRSPAQLDDVVDVTCSLAKQTGARLTFQQEVRGRASGVVHCQAEVQVACINLSTKRPTRISQSVLEGMQQWK